MKPVTHGIWQLTGYPPDWFNAYLVDGVLIDACTRWARGRILSQLRPRPPKLVALTHCHPDHQGVARAVCTRFGVPLACHEADVPAMLGRARMVPRNWIVRAGELFWAGPPHPVDRVLHDGDVIAGLRVVHAPGHTPGHVIYFRESDRVAICGDVLANINFVTRRIGLGEPPPVVSWDPLLNRESARILWRLQPSVICFGHGPPLRDMKQLQHYVAHLP